MLIDMSTICPGIWYIFSFTIVQSIIHLLPQGAKRRREQIVSRRAFRQKIWIVSANRLYTVNTRERWLSRFSIFFFDRRQASRAATPARWGIGMQCAACVLCVECVLTNTLFHELYMCSHLALSLGQRPATRMCSLFVDWVRICRMCSHLAFPPTLSA